jgi:hypothetical protein
VVRCCRIYDAGDHLSPLCEAVSACLPAAPADLHVADRMMPRMSSCRPALQPCLVRSPRLPLSKKGLGALPPPPPSLPPRDSSSPALMVRAARPYRRALVVAAAAVSLAGRGGQVAAQDQDCQIDPTSGKCTCAGIDMSSFGSKAVQFQYSSEPATSGGARVVVSTYLLSLCKPLSADDLYRFCGQDCQYATNVAVVRRDEKHPKALPAVIGSITGVSGNANENVNHEGVEEKQLSLTFQRAKCGDDPESPCRGEISHNIPNEFHLAITYGTDDTPTVSLESITNKTRNGKLTRFYETTAGWKANSKANSLVDAWKCGSYGLGAKCGGGLGGGCSSAGLLPLGKLPPGHFPNQSSCCAGKAAALCGTKFGCALDDAADAAQCKPQKDNYDGASFTDNTCNSTCGVHYCTLNGECVIQDTSTVPDGKIYKTKSSCDEACEHETLPETTKCEESPTCWDDVGNTWACECFQTMGHNICNSTIGPTDPMDISSPDLWTRGDTCPVCWPRNYTACDCFTGLGLCSTQHTCNEDNQCVVEKRPFGVDGKVYQTEDKCKEECKPQGFWQQVKAHKAASSGVTLVIVLLLVAGVTLVAKKKRMWCFGSRTGTGVGYSYNDLTEPIGGVGAGAEAMRTSW